MKFVSTFDHPNDFILRQRNIKLKSTYMQILITISNIFNKKKLLNQSTIKFD